MPLFIRFSVSRSERSIAFFRLIPSLVRCCFTRDRGEMKRKLIIKCFKNKTKSQLEEKAIEFVGHLDRMEQYRVEIMEDMKNHVQKGDDVCIVSGSADLWMKPWTDKYSVGLLSTRLAWKEGHVVDFDGKNCVREEKVERIKKMFDLKSYQEIVVYGNNGSDDAMLSLATKKHVY